MPGAPKGLAVMPKRAQEASSTEPRKKQRTQPTPKSSKRRNRQRVSAPHRPSPQTRSDGTVPRFVIPKTKVSIFYNPETFRPEHLQFDTNEVHFDMGPEDLPLLQAGGEILSRSVALGQGTGHNKTTEESYIRRIRAFETFWLDEYSKRYPPAKEGDEYKYDSIPADVLPDITKRPYMPAEISTYFHYLFLRADDQMGAGIQQAKGTPCLGLGKNSLQATVAAFNMIHSRCSHSEGKYERDPNSDGLQCRGNPMKTTRVTQTVETLKYKFTHEYKYKKQSASVMDIVGDYLRLFTVFTHINTFTSFRDWVFLLLKQLLFEFDADRGLVECDVDRFPAKIDLDLWEAKEDRARTGYRITIHKNGGVDALSPFLCAVRAICLYLALHTHTSNPNAPLFPSVDAGTGAPTHEFMTDHEYSRILGKACLAHSKLRVGAVCLPSFSEIFYNCHSTRHTFAFWIGLCGFIGQIAMLMGRWKTTTAWEIYNTNGTRKRQVGYTASTIERVQRVWPAYNGQLTTIGGINDTDNLSAGQRGRSAVRVSMQVERVEAAATTLLAPRVLSWVHQNYAALLYPPESAVEMDISAAWKRVLDPSARAPMPFDPEELTLSNRKPDDVLAAVTDDVDFDISEEEARRLMNDLVDFSKPATPNSEDDRLMDQFMPDKAPLVSDQTASSAMEVPDSFLQLLLGETTDAARRPETATTPFPPAVASTTTVIESLPVADIFVRVAGGTFSMREVPLFSDMLDAAVSSAPSTNRSAVQLVTEAESTPLCDVAKGDNTDSVEQGGSSRYVEEFGVKKLGVKTIEELIKTYTGGVPNLAVGPAREWFRSVQRKRLTPTAAVKKAWERYMRHVDVWRLYCGESWDEWRQLLGEQSLTLSLQKLYELYDEKKLPTGSEIGGAGKYRRF
ncbi:hypothetical protein DFJ73DRAFT_867326 [Zopfochytrium polystomum]|nr:hypothetical protein DFJ73DRAFT_867326 [Zopfochytrium polystomum]